MASFNKVILMGNLTRDPVVKYLPSGAAVAEIGLAVNRSYYDKQSNTRKEETTFVDVTVWGNQAETAGKYLSKGRQLLVEGRLQLDSWDDKQSGQKRSKLKVICENFTFINSGGGGAGGQSGGRPGGNQNFAPQQDDFSSQGGGSYGGESGMREPGQPSQDTTNDPSRARVDEFYSDNSDDDIPF